MKSKMMLAAVGLVLVGSMASADTTYDSTSYQTDFAGDVSADFCDGSIMEKSYTGTIHQIGTFADGSLTLAGRYGNNGIKALIQGGAQSANPVQIGVDGSSQPIMSNAYGMFFNSNVEMTYTLYNPGETAGVPNNHKDIVAQLGARKNNNPYLYRIPSYIVTYDGVRLSVGEWTYKSGAPIREIAGYDVAITDDTSTFKLVLNVQGGDDNDGVVAGATAATLQGQLWVDGVKVADVSGVDNPWNGTALGTGPELAGTAYNPAGDYGQGSWDPYAGDWNDESAVWSRSTYNGGGDIQTDGWVLMRGGQIGSNGTYQGIVVSEFSVNAVPEPATMVLMAAGIPVLLKRRRRRG